MTPVKKIDPRFLKESGTEVYTGNECLVKGCLETEGGVSLWTGYPGSPIAGFFDTAEELAPLLKEKGIHASLANNEALSVAMLNGSQMTGVRSIALMKSVGVHVAADGLALGNLAGVHKDGGVMVVLGDDPWSDSTQVPADSRFLARHLFMPVMEPSDHQEVKDWVNLGFKLSQASGFYIGYLITTNQADGGASVLVRPNHFPAINTTQQVEIDTARIPLEDTVLLPPRTANKEDGLSKRFEILCKNARELDINLILTGHTTSREIGFVTSGLTYSYLEHALHELGLDDQIPILKLGITYPVDPDMIEELAGMVKQIIVIEERRGFIEEQVVQIINRYNQRRAKFAAPILVWGKEFPEGVPGIPSTRGLHPSLLMERLAALFSKIAVSDVSISTTKIDQELELLRSTSEFQIRIPPRTPTFCPGCPHRDSSSVLMELKRQFRDPIYMAKRFGEKPVDLVFHGDTGCYTMLMFEPTKDLMHNYSGMGLGGGTGAGIDPFIKNKQVVFMGDSTFFHSGQLAISNSIKANQDITYIILDNKTTAMTGHQTTPSLEYDLMGNPTYAQQIERIVESMMEQQANVVRVNPENQATYKALLEETILRSGVKVIIADKECGITTHRREAREERQIHKTKGFLPKKKFINITEEACENCLECTKATGCPGLTFKDTPFGRKVQTDMTLCVSDGACTRFTVDVANAQSVKACPSFEEVIVMRKRPARHEEESALFDFSYLPRPKFKPLNKVWRAYLTGVGGMGIGISTAIIIRAGFKHGYNVQFCDKKGLAIRNGGVYSHIVFKLQSSSNACQVIPYGKADLLLGIDMLEATRAIDPKLNQRVVSPTHTVAVINTHKTPTILTLLGKDDFSVQDLEEQICRHTRPGEYFGEDVSELAEKFFGSKMYANIILLGIAFQVGHIPVDPEDIEWAIKETFGSAAPLNLRAFNLGRKVVLEPGLFALEKRPEVQSVEQVIQEKMEILRTTKSKGALLASKYENLVLETLSSLALDQDTKKLLAIRIYDLIQYENIKYARGYVERIRQVYLKDLSKYHYEATRAVIWNLHKVMAIKDEIFVAHLLTSEEKRRRDRIRYKVDPSNGDRIIYRHLNRPEFVLFGVHFKWDMRTQDWQLNLMKRMKFLRRLLPQWHSREREFRDWYTSLVSSFTYTSDESYRAYVNALKTPEQVTGYREIRYPKMAQAQENASEFLKTAGINFKDSVSVDAKINI